MASWPSSIVSQTASVGALYLVLFIAVGSGGPGRGQSRLLRLMERGVRGPTVRAVVKLAVVPNVPPSEMIQRMETLLDRPRKSEKTKRD